MFPSARMALYRSSILIVLFCAFVHKVHIYFSVSIELFWFLFVFVSIFHRLLKMISLLCCRYQIIVASSEKTPESDSDAIDVITPPMNCVSLSSSVSDSRIGVVSFCKAFPWHFIIDRKLEIVQLGAGFMRLFGSRLKELGAYHDQSSFKLNYDTVACRTSDFSWLPNKPIPQFQ